jgi:predicted nucleotidyltransferase
MTDQVRNRWTADSILGFLQSHRAELRALGVQKIGLFGSYVRGEQSAGSDMDFLVTLDKFTWQHWMDVWNYLEDHFGAQVDVVPEKDLREELRPRVLREVRYVETV